MRKRLQLQTHEAKTPKRKKSCGTIRGVLCHNQEHESLFRESQVKEALSLVHHPNSRVSARFVHEFSAQLRLFHDDSTELQTSGKFVHGRIALVTVSVTTKDNTTWSSQVTPFPAALHGKFLRCL